MGAMYGSGSSCSLSWNCTPPFGGRHRHRTQATRRKVQSGNNLCLIDESQAAVRLGSISLSNRNPLCLSLDVPRATKVSPSPTHRPKAEFAAPFVAKYSPSARYLRNRLPCLSLSMVLRMPHRLRSRLPNPSPMIRCRFRSPKLRHPKQSRLSSAPRVRRRQPRAEQPWRVARDARPVTR